MRATRGPYVDARQEARAWFALLDLLLRLPSLPLEVLFRRKFGERYLTPGAVIASGLFAHAAMRALSGLPPLGIEGGSIGARLFLASYCGLALGQAFEIARRRRSGERWHSYSDGVSLKAWHLLSRRTEVVQGRLEPLAALALAALVAGHDGALGAYIALSAAAWAWKQARLRARRRAAWLDHVDRWLERRHLRAAWLHGLPPSETCGVVGAGDPARHAALVEAFLASLVEEEDAAAGVPEATASQRVESVPPPPDTPSREPFADLEAWAERFRRSRRRPRRVRLAAGAVREPAPASRRAG